MSDKGVNTLKRKGLFAIVVFLLFLAACSDVKVSEETKWTRSTLPKFIFEKDEFPPSAPGYVKVGDTRYEMEKGNFEWKMKNRRVQTDAASPDQIAEHFKAIVLAPNSKVSIEIEQNPNLSAYFWNYEGKVDLQNGRITVPSIKGRYIYEVLAIWSNGQVSYTFVVEVK